jgi:hypothetical protein
VPPSISRFLIHTVDPAETNVIFSYLVRLSRKHLHGLRETTLLFMCALSILSARLLPSHAFSFNIWFVLFYAYLLAPGITLQRRLRRTPDGLHLLMLPLRSSDYVRGLTRFFLLVTLYCAIPFALFWICFFLMRPFYFPNWFVMYGKTAVALAPAFHSVLLVLSLWVFYWCSILGGFHLLVFVLYLVALLGDGKFEQSLVYMQLMPPPRVLVESLLGLYVTIYIAAGIMYLRRQFLARVLRRIY